MYSRECKQCGKSFLTGNYNDDLCLYCNGDFRRLDYYEIKK